MSEIRIIFQQLQQSLQNTVVNSSLSQQLIDTLRVGQNLTAQLVISDKQFWLIIDGVKLSIPKETAEQWQLLENQSIKLKVKSLSSPVELQIIKNPVQSSSPSNSALPNQSTTPVKQELNSKQVAKIIETATTPSIIAKQSIIANKPHTRLIESNHLLKDIDGSKINKQASDLAKPISSDKSIDVPIVKNQPSRKIALPAVTPKTSEINPSKSKESTPTTTYQNTKSQVETSVSSNPRDRVVNSKVSESMQSLISASKKVISQNDSLLPVTKTVIPNNPETHKVTLKLDQTSNQPTSSNINSKIITDSALIKSPSINVSQPLKIEQPEAKVVSLSTIQEPIKSNTKSAVLNSASQGIKNNQQSASTQKLKFEIPVILPDKERFPLLADKLVAAFTQIQTKSNNSGKSITQLFSQLSRLHQWIAEHKTAGRTDSGAQASKSANDLKESLKDLFRYISHKDTLKTGKSIERALKQSGTFLEKRIATQKETGVQKQAKAPTELTLHKDIKANLNRVLATALYNLAKINTPKSSSPQTPHPSQTTAKANTSPSSSLSASTTQKTLTDNSLLQSSNLLNNIKTRLKKFTAGRAMVTNLPELEYITKEVLKNVQEALSRTQLGQLTNLRPESSTQQWLFELPVMNGKSVDSFSIYLNEEEESADEEESKQRRWSVVLQFEIGELGKIRSMLSWENDKIQVRFLAEQQNTVNLVGTELEYFQEMLNKQDITFEQLTVEQALLDDMSVQFSGGIS